MTEFSYTLVSGDNSDLIDAIYQLGVENPIPPDYACSPHPHPLKREIQEVADSDDYLLAIYADGELRSVVSFDQEGTTKFGFTKPYGDGTYVHPQGRELMEYQYGIVKSLCGRARTVQNKNPGAIPFYEEFGIETE